MTEIKRRQVPYGYPKYVRTV